MKYQIFLITLLMGVALAFPVPDEEVSPGSAAVAHIGEIKSEASVDKPALKTTLTEEPNTKPQPVQVIQEKQQESKKIEEEPKPKIENAKLEEKKPLLALGVPDSELPQNLPEEQKPLTEIKEKEKNIRSENLANEELKSLPSGIFETPVIAPSAVETQKQIVEEEKPVLQVILPEGKNAASSLAASTAAIATEEKELKPILLEEKVLAADAILPSSAAADISPAATEDFVASVTVDESKKVDLTGRQERGGNEAKKESEDIISEVPASAPAETITEDVSPLKVLENDKPLVTAEKLPLPEAAAAPAPALSADAPAADLKVNIENKAEDLKSAFVGGIETQKQSLDENETKIQEITEIKDSSWNILLEGKKIETDVAKEAKEVIKPDAIVNETAQPLITSESKNASEEKKDSLESKESVESEESKGKSEENMSN